MSASDNLKNVMKNDKQRTVIVSLGVVVLLMLAAGFFFATKNSAANRPQVATVSTGSVPTTQSIPGSNPSDEYNKAIKASNEKKANDAIAAGRSSEITLTADRSGMKSAIDATTDAENERRRRALEEAKPVEVVVQPPTPVVVQLQQEAPIVAQPVIVAPPPEVKKPNYTADQYALIAALSQSYRNKKSAIETDYTQGQNGSKDNGQMVAGTQTGNANALASATQDEGTTLMKAGDMLNAILETAIKSDEPSPVLARVVGGKYNGARAVCSVQGNGEKALVECRRLSLPNLSKSVAVNLVAIDPNSTRSGLATSVDRHYFERYVVGLGAVFLKGYADALARQNTTTAITGSGSVVVATGQLSNADIAKSGIGEVGKSIADDVKQNSSNLKPTVYVAAGTAIGLMATDDIIVK